MIRIIVNGKEDITVPTTKGVPIIANHSGCLDPAVNIYIKKICKC